MQFAYVGVAILLVVILTSTAPKYGGWLLFLLTLGMLFAGRKYLSDS